MISHTTFGSSECGRAVRPHSQCEEAIDGLMVVQHLLICRKLDFVFWNA